MCARVAVGTCVSSHAPRPDPYVRLSRIRLLPRVCDGTSGRIRSSACDTLTRFCARHVLLLVRIPLGPRPSLHRHRCDHPCRRLRSGLCSLCSPASSLLWRGPTSRIRASSASVPHLPDADRPAHATSDGQTRDLPGSDAIPLHVMWPLTPAGRQHLAWRCRTCCLRANKDSRPPRYRSFEAQSHTPCNRCVRFAVTVTSAHARLPTKRTLLLTWGGLGAAGSDQVSLAHLLDHFVGAREQRQRHREAECPGSLEINNHLHLGGLLYGKIRRLLAFKNPAGVEAHQTIRVCKTASVANQAASRRELTILVNRGHRETDRQCGELPALGVEEYIGADHEPGCAQLAQGCKDCIEIAFGAGV